MTTVDRRDDAETHAIEAVQAGGPVDPPPRKTTFAEVVSAYDDRPPLVPSALRNRHQRRELLRSVLRIAGYELAKHVKLSPVYAAKTAWYAPKGVFVLAWRSWRWAYDLEQWGERQRAADRDDVDSYMKLIRVADRHRRGRVPIFITVLVLLVVLVAAAVRFAPWPAQAALAVAAVAVLARAGRPAGKPILDRTTRAPRFTRLTGEMVRDALCVIGAGIKDPAAITFPPPGIHRDGPGWLARTNLPGGVTAVKVMEKREELSSALRLPVDQVWPAVGVEHAGQLDLWVGYLPTSRMGRPKWELAAPTAVTSYFEPIPVGTDQRLRAVTTTMFQRSYLVGGQPGAGKSTAGRALVFGVLLDPTAEVWLAAFKAAEDFYDIAEFCTRYECGVDDATIRRAEQMVTDGLREVQRRQTLLGKLKREGRIVEGRTDPQLARAGIGLHPLVLVFDEVHELFLESKQAASTMTRLIKQARSAGVTIVLITQVADKDSVPPNVTKCVSSRWCLSVADQVANDQIMGTGAYKRGQSGTVFRPRVDAGWGATSGMSDDTADGPVRAYYPDEDEVAVLIDRIRAIRAGSTFATSGDDEPAADVLADVLRVFVHAGRPGLHWQTIAEVLAEQAPQRYADVTAESVSALVRDHGVPTVDVKVGRVTRKGCKRAAVEAAIETRGIDGGGPARSAIEGSGS